MLLLLLYLIYIHRNGLCTHFLWHNVLKADPVGKKYTLYSLCLFQFYYLFPLNEECAIISNVVSTIVKILQVFVHGSEHLHWYSADITSELFDLLDLTQYLHFTYFLLHFHHRIWDNIICMIKTFAAKAWPVFLNRRKTLV